MKFILFYVILDLSDNLTEMRFMVKLISMTDVIFNVRKSLNHKNTLF